MTNCKLIAITLLALVGMGAYAQAGDSVDEIKRYKNLGYVIVTPEGPKDGGDFGPLTPGTRTAGIQEALDSAQKSKANWWPDSWAAKNVYIARGMYNTEKTITVPWMGENWVLEGRGSTINYGGANGDALVIDSQMNNQIKLGYILGTGLTEGAVVHLRPTMSFDKDIAPKGVITCSTIQMYAIVGGGDVISRKNKKPTGVGLYIDSSSGPVLDNAIFVNEINACGTSIYLHNGKEGGGIISNSIEVIMNHLGGTALQMGDSGCGGVFDNTLSMSMEGYIGARIFGWNNIITFRGISTETGRDVIFEPESRDNTVYSTGPIKGITNNAVVPTNRVITSDPIGFAVETPAFPASGKELVNRAPYTVVIGVTKPGTVTGWTETDAKGAAVDYTGCLTTGQKFIMEPGEKIKFTYSEKPEWKWKALR